MAMYPPYQPGERWQQKDKSKQLTKHAGHGYEFASCRRAGLSCNYLQYVASSVRDITGTDRAEMSFVGEFLYH